jgi:hypothetical protein
MLVSMSVTIDCWKSAMPIRFATHFAVAGISCISPIAPALERTSVWNRLSCRITP